MYSLEVAIASITRETIATAVADCSTIQLRDGVQEFLRQCQEAKPPIPVLIMSAGLGDVIEEFLRQRLPFPLAPTTVVVSNRLYFDSSGQLTAFSEPLMHMFNKTAAFFDANVRKLIEGCKMCMLLGDGVGDATMADGLDNVECLKIGFLNEKVEERMAAYKQVFHELVLHDGPVPQTCFNAIKPPPQASPHWLTYGIAGLLAMTIGVQCYKRGQQA